MDFLVSIWKSILIDQQYDKTVISKSGEFYAWTVKEAFDAGFRRAKRWMQEKKIDLQEKKMSSGLEGAGIMDGLK